jgi:hypothetical protein
LSGQPSPRSAFSFQTIRRPLPNHTNHKAIKEESKRRPAEQNRSTLRKCPLWLGLRFCGALAKNFQKKINSGFFIFLR